MPGSQATRRDLLRVGALAPLALATACADGSGVALAQRVVDDVNLLGASLLPLLPVLGAVQGIPADAVASATQAATTVIGLVNRVGSGIAQATALPLIQQIGANAGTLISALSPWLGLLPPPFGTVILAVQVLIPVIEVAVGLMPGPMAPGPQVMTPDQARLVLTAASTRRFR